MKAAGAGLWAQFITLARSPNSLLVLATMPLTTVAILAAVRTAGRNDLVGQALIGPSLMAQWAMALLVAGELVASERWQRTLDLVVASPTSLPALLIGRVVAVTAIGTVSFIEAWAVAAFAFGIDVDVADPAGFGLAVAATAFAMAGWATVFAAVLAVCRSPQIIQNALTFPCYLLGGVLVPVSFLPAPAQWLSRGLFLSWSADLLRATYGQAAVDDFVPRLLVVAGLGLCGFVAGNLLLVAALRTLRASGRLSLA